MKVPILKRDTLASVRFPETVSSRSTADTQRLGLPLELFHVGFEFFEPLDNLIELLQDRILGTDDFGLLGFVAKNHIPTAIADNLNSPQRLLVARFAFDANFDDFWPFANL